MPTLVILMHIDSLLWIQSLPDFQTKPNQTNLAKLMGVIKKHDLANKNTTTKTKTKTMTMTISFREYLQNASLRLLTFETFDQGDKKT